jgi:hypothetical protein
VDLGQLNRLLELFLIRMGLMGVGVMGMGVMAVGVIVWGYDSSDNEDNEESDIEKYWEDLSEDEMDECPPKRTSTPGPLASRHLGDKLATQA